MFELSPSDAGWTYGVLYSFSGYAGGPCCGSLAIDANGTLYGTTLQGGADGYGLAFRLTPSSGGWSYTDLHDFPLIGSDGADPYNPVVLDSSGNLYGVAAVSGANLRGTVWEIAPWQFLRRSGNP